MAAVPPAMTLAQQPPYDVYPEAEPPYYRLRYEGSSESDALAYPVKYTIWIPPQVKALRGLIVHQHGCGEGSCKSGLTGAFDLHWQALARKHDCALMAPSYEQPGDSDCQAWCDPRNGSDAIFQQSLVDLGDLSGHPELAKVPWALWGHSGGGVWAGTMTLLHPQRVAAAWLRSGVPYLVARPDRPNAIPIEVPEEPIDVPIMLNQGTKEGVTVKEGRFAGVWPATERFFNAVRGKGAPIGVAIDPLTGHETGNQRYLAIPWLDACLGARLPTVEGEPLNPMPTEEVWLATLLGTKAQAESEFTGDKLKAVWLPNRAIANAWMQYVKDTNVTDSTPPPAPTNVRLANGELIWKARADLESGLSHFLIKCDGQVIAKVPENAKNRFGRPIFQGLQYSDTPSQPLVEMQYTDANAKLDEARQYAVIAVNTAGLKSQAADAQ